MKLNKNASYILLQLLNGNTTAAQLHAKLTTMDLRSVQRALVRLAELGLITRNGTNSPTYNVNYDVLVQAEISDKLLEDVDRPVSQFHHNFLAWLASLSPKDPDQLFGSVAGDDLANKSSPMSAKELEYLTIELSWKSSSLEGNTYTLLDTQLLLLEGIKAKDKTEFETQMILNHKKAITFIVEHKELFAGKIAFGTLEELHRIIGYNLGIAAGVRKKFVRITASNYEPLANPHQLREAADTVLTLISRTVHPLAKALLALALVPYLQIFEDGNKRTGRMLANAILIHSVGRGFSLRKTDARELALAYLAFYEFNSARALSGLLLNELE